MSNEILEEAVEETAVNETLEGTKKKFTLKKLDFKKLSFKKPDFKKLDFKKIKNLPAFLKQNISYNQETKKVRIGKREFKRKVVIVALVVLVLLIGLGVRGIVKSAANRKMPQFSMVKVERRNIENTVTASATLEANDSYNVTALVTGEVISDSFNEGDTVKKDDVLYQIEATTAQNNVTSAKNSVEKAERSYQEAIRNKANTAKTNDFSIQSAQHSLQKAKNSLDDASEAVKNLNVSSTYTGTVSAVYITEGIEISNGTKIADVYNDSIMKISIPFNEADAEEIWVGATATLTVAGASGELYGTVTSISSASVAMQNHSIVRYVTIEVENPGALTVNDKATAAIADIYCSGSGQFEYVESGTILAKTSGKVESLNIQANDHVYYGQIVANLSSDTVQNNYTNAKNSYTDAQNSLEKAVMQNKEFAYDDSVRNAAIALDDAKLSLEKQMDTLENYTIKAPISGTVVTKNTKAGDKLDNSSQSSSSAMAIIYDLSALKMQLAIDETEISQVKVGQEVTITADAVKGKNYTGIIEKVGVDGTSSNGVTTYPVDVIIKEYGDLLPGMNVDATIIVASAENVLALPVGTVNRGNVVWVEGEKEDEKDTAPNGFKSVKVEIGINDDSYIEIKSGLEEGQEVRGPMIASGNDATGTAPSTQQGMPSMGAIHGGMSGMGGGARTGGMSGGMSGGNRTGGMSGNSNRSGGMR